MSQIKNVANAWAIAEAKDSAPNFNRINPL